jgi:hypothetical protein
MQAILTDVKGVDRFIFEHFFTQIKKNVYCFGCKYKETHTTDHCPIRQCDACGEFGHSFLICPKDKLFKIL